MSSEFELIRQLAARQTTQRSEVSLGIGDDAAILNIPDGYELVVSTDTLNSGVHFPEDTSAEDIGYKSLAVNLSDMAAMGAEPVAVNLSLSLPDSDEQWLQQFSMGFLQLAEAHQVQLMGGDTTHGPLSISVTIFGVVPSGQAIKRSGAKAGDLVYVTGTLGDAGAALLALQGELKLTGPQHKVLLERLNRPQARVNIGLLIRQYATACIDISDGLAADLGHILEQSGIGATLYVDQIPLSDVMQDSFELAGGWTIPLHAGDDYELCFTVPGDKQGELEKLLVEQGLTASCIGMTETGDKFKLMMPDGSTEVLERKGYDHFSE